MIPLFKQYEIKGTKYLDFLDFCLVAELMKNKCDLTLEGLEKIRLIKSKMNKRRHIKH